MTFDQQLEFAKIKGSGNGSGKILWFLLTTIVLVVFALVESWATSINSTTQSHEMRLNSVEKSIAVQQVQTDEMHQWMEKIDLKLDNIQKRNH